MKIKFLSISLVVLVVLIHNASQVKSELVDYTCSANATVSALLSRATPLNYLAWIQSLSGEIPVRVGGVPLTLATRYTPAMFYEPEPNARAFDYIEEQVRLLVQDHQVKQHAFSMAFYTPLFTAKNLIVEFPGVTKPDEVVILSAHLDSRSESPYLAAPGADDNATGSAALLEAVRLLRNARFARTIRVIWFTGEEQGLKGSLAYVNDPQVFTGQIVGVINLDMFGYDADNDHCFEMHVGTLPASNTVAQCFSNAITANSPGLTWDTLTSTATWASDHSPFWGKGIGALEILENFSVHNQPGGCVEPNGTPDKNPNYHKTTDTIANMNTGFAYDIARAGIAAAAGLAGPLDACLQIASPTLTYAETSPGVNALGWQAVSNAQGYRVFRSTQSCGGEIDQTADTPSTTWEDRFVMDGHMYYYWVEAVSTDGCFTLSNSCAGLEAQAFSQFFPSISN